MPPDRTRDDEAEDEEARAFVLARRAKFIAAALASASFVNAACNPQPCLTPPTEPNEQPRGTGGAEPIIGVAGGVPVDAGDDAEPNTGGMPLPCLTPVRSKKPGSEE